MKPISTIGFDCYGTLLESHGSKEAYKLLYRIIARYSKIIDRKSYVTDILTRKFRSIREIMTYYGALNIPMNEINMLEHKFQESISGISIKPGAWELLDTLKRSWYKLFLSANVTSAYAEAPKALGIEQCMDSIHYSCNTGIIKPDKRAFTQSMRYLDSTSEHTIFIGNDSNDTLEWTKNCWIPLFHIDDFLSSPQSILNP